MKNKLTFSLLFVFFICFLNAINFALNGILFDKFAMQTKSFFSDIELWRAFTFSFFTNSIEGFALFLFVFLFISNKIELFLGNKTYPIFLVLITFVIGTTTTISMVNENIIFAGLEGTSFFVISMFLFLTKKKIIINSNKYLNIAVIISVILWGGTKTYISMKYGFINIVPSIIMAACGIIISFMFFLQINYLINKRIKEKKEKIINQKTKSASDFVGYSIYTNPKFKKHFYDKIESNYWLVKEKIEKKENEIFTINTLTDEEKLDKILDKINDVGQSNLTKQEVDFLNYYSNKLKE